MTDTNNNSNEMINKEKLYSSNLSSMASFSSVNLRKKSKPNPMSLKVTCKLSLNCNKIVLNKL